MTGSKSARLATSGSVSSVGRSLNAVPLEESGMSEMTERGEVERFIDCADFEASEVRLECDDDRIC